jgi:hypothetical protein
VCLEKNIQDIQNPKFKFKYKIQNSKSKIQNSKFKIQNSKFKIHNQNPKIQNSKLKIQIQNSNLIEFVLSRFCILNLRQEGMKNREKGEIP